MFYLPIYLFIYFSKEYTGENTFLALVHVACLARDSKVHVSTYLSHPEKNGCTSFVRCPEEVEGRVLTGQYETGNGR